MADKFVFEEIFDGGGGSASPTLGLDTTLTQSGKAADAKAVGDAVTEINQKIEELSTADQQSKNTIKSITTRLSSVDKKADDNKTSITDITSRVTALEENPGGGVTSWNDLKDKPFGETVVNGDTLTVDWGTFDGSVQVVVNGQTFVKAADVVPTLEDFANGCSAIVNNQTIAYTYAELFQSNTDNGYIVTETFASVPSDWFGVGSEDDYVEFPKKGVYFVKNNTTSLTIPNYTGFVTTTIQKIDAKYLPEGSGSSVELDTTLTQSGKAADAKAVGDAIAKVSTGGGNTSGGGIIDIDQFFWSPGYGDYNENAIYRLPMGLYYVEFTGDGRTLYSKHGTTYDVYTLPEVGEPATIEGETVNAVYYCRDDNDAYGYIQETIAAALGVSAGWYDIRTLFNAFNFTYVGIVNNVRNMKENKSFYFVDNHSCFSFKNGSGGSLSGSETTLLTIEFEDVNTPVKLSSGSVSRIRADFENTKIRVSANGTTIVLDPAYFVATSDGGDFTYSTIVVVASNAVLWSVNVYFSPSGMEAALHFKEINTSPIT